MAAKMSLRIRFRVLSILTAVIPTGSLCQMQAKSLGVIFL